MKFIELFDNKGLIFLAMLLIAGFIAFKASQPVPTASASHPSHYPGRVR